jgi:hypothetical protein
MKVKYRAERCLELVHGDFCGPISPATPRGNKYFLLPVDYLSRYMWVVVIPSKDRVAAAINDIHARTEEESGLLRALRTNTAPYNSQQNDIVECQNGMVVATARSKMMPKGLPRWLWGEAVNAAVYVLNRCPAKRVDGMTPFEAWHGRKLAVHHLRTFRCIVYVGNMTPHLKKLEDCGRKMIFVGYESGSNAYHAYDPIMKHVLVTRDIVFDEQA